MTIDAYLEAMKERFVTDPLVTHFQALRERSTLMDGYLRARLALADGSQLELSEYMQRSSAGEIVVITGRTFQLGEGEHSTENAVRFWNSPPRVPKEAASRCYACATAIRDDDPSVQRLLRVVENADSLTALILAAWQVARVLAVHVIEAVLAERARRPTAWPPCPVCGTSLRSKGFAPRQITSVCGPIRWQRRVGRCPQGCTIPQVAPLDDALGVQPQQRASGELQYLGCALAVLCAVCHRRVLAGVGTVE